MARFSEVGDGGQVASQQPPIGRTELYGMLARRLRASGLHAYFWRDPDEFPRLVGFDLDIVVDVRSWSQVILLVQEILRQAGWGVVAHVRRGTVHTFLAMVEDNAVSAGERFLQIDLHRFLTASAVPYVDIATLVERSVAVEGAPFLCLPDGATISMLGPLLMGISPKDRYLKAFADAKRTDRERVAQLIQQAVGVGGEELMRRGEPAAMLWRRALFQALRRRPITFLAVIRSIIADRLTSFIAPSGLVLSVSGPDGVGKSTVIDAICKLSRRRVCMNSHIYHTRPYIIPRLAYLLPRKQRQRILTVRQYEPPPSRLKSGIRLLILILDYNLGYWFKIRPRLARGDLVVFDRYFLDVRVDPRIRGISATDRTLRRIEALIPQPHFKVILSALPETIVSRKTELDFDTASQQLARYRALGAESPNCLLLATDRTTPLDLAARIVEQLRE